MKNKNKQTINLKKVNVVGAKQGNNGPSHEGSINLGDVPANQVTATIIDKITKQPKTSLSATKLISNKKHGKSSIKLQHI